MIILLLFNQINQKLIFKIKMLWKKKLKINKHYFNI